MSRRLIVFGYGVFLALALGYLAAARPIIGYGGIQPPQANLKMMKEGTAYRPYVRRQLVPFLVRSVDRAIPAVARERWNHRLAGIAPLRPFLLERSAAVDRADAVDGVLCLLLWLGFFTLFAATLESEARHYLNDPRFRYPYPPWLPALVTAGGCVVVALLLHHNFIYDPVTLACSMLVVPVLRSERLLPLLVLTAIFSFNRETAFLFAGLAFFYWVHCGRYRRAVLTALALLAVYLCISGSIEYTYRHNPGWAAIDNLRANLRAYSHRYLPHASLFVVVLVLYALALASYWRRLPPELKAFQWFLVPWIGLHLFWGWMFEWRVFFELLPGVLLTSLVIWASYSRERRMLHQTHFVLWEGTQQEMRRETLSSSRGLP